MAQIRDALYDPATPPLPENQVEFDYVRDDRRLDEAAAVDPVVRAFAAAEIHPRGRGLGIHGPTSYTRSAPSWTSGSRRHPASS